MSDSNRLQINGLVERPMELSYDDLAGLEDGYQLNDVSRFDAKRKGDAIQLSGLLRHVGVHPEARYLGLHASRDDFHASIPLEPIREKAFVIYRLQSGPLDASAGGPFRFYIPDHAACHTDEIDECANVKFVDHIELTAEKGYDNRPDDEEEHERLHREQG